jgi:hypothetical protein
MISTPKRYVTKPERSGAIPEAPAVVAGLDDVAVMGETIEQSRCQLWIAEYTRPFAKGLKQHAKLSRFRG